MGHFYVRKRGKPVLISGSCSCRLDYCFVCMQPWDQDFTHSHAGVDLKRTEMPKIDEVSESENISRSEETVKNGEQNAIVTKTEDVSLRRLILQCLILTP